MVEALVDDEDLASPLIWYHEDALGFVEVMDEYALADTNPDDQVDAMAGCFRDLDRCACSPGLDLEAASTALRIMRLCPPPPKPLTLWERFQIKVLCLILRVQFHDVYHLFRERPPCD